MNSDTIMQRLLSEKDRIRSELKKGYATPYSFLLTPSDDAVVRSVQRIAAEKFELKPTLLLLIGIGGSSLGAVAVIEGLYGCYYNEILSNQNARMKFYCADTIDELLCRQLHALVEEELKNKGRVLICMVSKSGTTMETVVNGALFFELLKKYHPQDYQQYVIIITDSDSPLEKVGREIGATVLTIPQYVGGRFSVFTAVGLFPLMMLGIAADAFCKSAQSVLQDFFADDCTETLQPICESAERLYQAYLNGYTIHDIFVFAPELTMLGNWYRQLIGESLGKSHTIDGQEKHCGFTPTVSVGTVDLHSVLQLYLAGPAHRFTTFIHFIESADTQRANTSTTNSSSIEIDDNAYMNGASTSACTVPINEISSLINELTKKNHSVSAIKSALFKGVKAAYSELPDRPFAVYALRERSSYAIGRFMMEKMIETVLLAHLFSINAFDQPAIERYKKYARSAL